ncbi:unnamed protein product, partial [Urochloa humidicola]
WCCNESSKTESPAPWRSARSKEAVLISRPCWMLRSNSGTTPSATSSQWRSRPPWTFAYPTPSTNTAALRLSHRLSPRSRSTRPRHHACGASCVFSPSPASSTSNTHWLTTAASSCTGSLRHLSRLLVGSAMNVSPFLTLMLNTLFVSPFLGLHEWFQHEMPGPSPFKFTHGRDLWDMNDHDASFGKLFDKAMVADSGFIMDIVVKECSDVFKGITSLVDVAGGLGGATQAIAKAFPHVECSVLELSHVVASAPTGTDVKYIAGDMFESVPSANAVFLKWVMHDWGDADCVKILKNCKKAIPSKEKGGKVIILDIMVGAGSSSDQKHVETQVLFDLFIMFINGAERDEQEWKNIIFEAGFSDYKITPILGVRSIIEAYP